MRLIGWKSASSDKNHLSYLGSNTSSVWNFYAHFSEVISRETSGGNSFLKLVYLSLCPCSNTVLKSYHMKCSCFAFHLTHIHRKHNQSRDSLWDRRSHLRTDHIHAQLCKPYTHTDQQERLNSNYPNKRCIILAQSLGVFVGLAVRKKPGGSVTLSVTSHLRAGWGFDRAENALGLRWYKILIGWDLMQSKQIYSTLKASRSQQANSKSKVSTFSHLFHPGCKARWKK